MTKLRIVAATACLGLLAACSSGSDDSGDSTPPSSSAPSSDTSVASATPTTAAVTSEAPDSDLVAALLTAAEVGTGYTVAADDGDDNSPLPCTPSAPALFDQAKPDDKATQNFQNGAASVQISEVVADYDDEAGAAKAYQVGATGFTCSSGTLNDAKVAIVKRPSGTPSGPIDDIGAWDFATGGVKGTAVLVRLGEKLVGLTFIATPAAADAVEVGQIVDRAATKVVSAD